MGHNWKALMACPNDTKFPGFIAAASNHTLSLPPTMRIPFNEGSFKYTEQKESVEMLMRWGSSKN
jgi:hypothetical protein